MSANEPALLDPFAVSAPDEAAELSALVRTLELAEGFQLIFVRCNQIPQREHLMEEVRSRLPKLNIQTIFFRESIQHLLDSMQEQLTTPLPDAVFVSGLEFSLPVAAEAHAAPLIANINAARNSLVELLPCPLVIWVPEHVLSAIANGAPDFFSIRSSVYFFSAKPSEIISLGQNLSIGEFWQVESLSQNEKQERIIALERLLTDYEFLPAKQRNHYTEVRLLEQLGALFHAQGETEKSLVCSGRALEIAEKLGDLAGVVTSLHNIGMVKQDQGNYGQALGYFQRALKISEELGRLSGVADALIEIGNVQYLSGNLLAAVEYFQRALKLNEDLGKQPGVASSLHNLGNVYQTQGNIEAALDCGQRALKINEEIGNIAGMANSLHQIGTLQLLQGNYKAALHYSERALKLSEEMGDVAGVALTLGQIGQLLIDTRQFAEAFEVLINVLGKLTKLQSPNVKVAVNDLKALRSNWSGFDTAWRAATSNDLPEWLLQGEIVEK